MSINAISYRQWTRFHRGRSVDEASTALRYRRARGKEVREAAHPAATENLRSLKAQTSLVMLRRFDCLLMSRMVSVSVVGWPVHHAQHRRATGFEEAPNEKRGDD